MLETYYEKVQHIAHKTAKRYVKLDEPINDIVQLTLIQYYLNKDKVDESKLFSWIYTVTKNFCMQYYREHSNEDKLMDRLIVENQPHYDAEVPDSKKEDQAEVTKLDFDRYTFINDREISILKKYIANGKDVIKLARDFKVKKKTLQNRINNLLNEIKFYHLLESKPYSFNPIPGTKLSRNMKNCLNKITASLQTNDLDKLKNYLSDCKINDTIKVIKIKEIKTYRIKITSANNYKLVVGYSDFEDRIKFCIFNFTILKDFSIRITEFPIIPNLVIAYDKKYVEGVKGLKRLTDSRGASKNLFGTGDEIIKKGIGKVVQTREGFGKE